MHLHTDQGVAVAAQKEGLLPIAQHALIVGPRLAYHDYEGIALNLDERERLVADIGDKAPDAAAQSRHAGSVGDAPATAGSGCSTWSAPASSRSWRCRPAATASSTGAGSVAGRGARRRRPRASGGGLAWPGCLRKLDRESAGLRRLHDQGPSAAGRRARLFAVVRTVSAPETYSHPSLSLDARCYV